MKRFLSLLRMKTAAPLVQSVPERFPSGSPQAIAVVNLEPEDFSERFGLTFQEDDDDNGIGPYKFCAFKIDKVGQVVLQRYDWRAELGTEILVDSRQDFKRSLKILMDRLQLESDDINWTVFETENGAES